MDLVIATHNPHKFAEISALLSDLDLALIPLPPSVVLPEDGVTLEENAISKGEAAVRATGEIALADDEKAALLNSANILKETLKQVQ